MGQGRDTRILRVSLVIKLIEVYVEPVLPWDFGKELLGTGNLSLVVVLSEPRDAVMFDHAGFFGKLEKPEGAIAIPGSAEAMKECFGGSTPSCTRHQENVQATSIFARHPSRIVPRSYNAAAFAPRQ